MSQSTLFEFASDVNKTSNSTFKMTDEAIDYLYNSSCPERLLEIQIENKLLEEEAEREDWKRREEEFLESHLRVGSNGKSKRT